MSNTFQCGDNTALVGYLYDECEPGERAAIDAHIVLCPACAAEVAALQSARQQLSSWTPPGADLGFAIVRSQASGPRAEGWSNLEAADRPRPAGPRAGAWFRQPMPVWAQVAAACLLFGTGLSLGVLRGTTPSTSPAQTVATTSNIASATTVTTTDLAALEQRLRAEMAELRAVPASTAAAAPQPNNAQILAQVRALIDESEQRQQRELALRTAQVVRDFDSQRRVDLAQIQRNFGQIEGLTGAEVREQRQMLNYLMRVSEQR
jgi:anti-sigma factor ChrR (cupin superfamily)